MYSFIFTILLGLSATAHAKVSLDTDKGNTTFRVNGQLADADEALKAAIGGAKVMRCKPKAASGKKIFFTNSGSTSEVVECTEVEVKINPKTGAPKWSVVK